MLACGVLCVCLALYFMYSGKHTVLVQGMVGKGPQKIFNIDKDEISGILLRGGTNLGAEKKGRSWWITEPKLLMADQKEVGRLVSELVDLRVERIFKAQGSLDEFGLDAPALIISVRTHRGWYNLAFGDESPTSSFCYALVPGKKDVMLLPVQVKQVLGKDLFSLRDRHLVHIVPESIRKMRLVSPRVLLDIEKDESGDWHYSGYGGQRLKAGLVNGFISRLAGTEAMGFPEERIVSEEPGTVIELDSSNRTFRIEMWKQGKRTFCISDMQRENVEVDGSFLHAMPADPDAIVDRRIVDLRQQGMRKIEISGSPGRIFTKQRDGWYADGRRIVNPAQLTSFINLLGSIERKDEYLLLPRDARKERGIRINNGTTSPGFDIILYSQYYVTVGKKVYRINEGDMKSLGASLNVLLEKKR